uniref:Translin n=1 Tax=Ciona savignyi TaxID=51511 RepID=H2ZEV0_CIOSA
ECVLEVFGDIETCLKTEYNLKEKIREILDQLEQHSRRISTVLQTIHQPVDINTTKSEVCTQVKVVFTDVRICYSNLSSLVEKQDYFKFCNLWQGVTTRFSFYLSLVCFLECGKLANRQDIADQLGLNIDKKHGFHLELDDYLCGLLLLASELARFAVNCVTAGDFQTPLAISKFVHELESGFRLLNLKNDFLRKKYDGLKYESKKIEQVVYDIKIRGLNSKLEA